MQPRLPFDAPSRPTTLDSRLTTLDSRLTTIDSYLYVRHPRARRYVIRVRADGSVRVTIPRWGTRREARAFAAAEQRWIVRERQRVDAERRQVAAVVPSDVAHAARARAAHELPARLGELASAHGLTVARISIRNQRRRWGSCAANGHICLNWRLALVPGEVRDYVMIHELMHLKRMDHSRAFWKLVARACPEYESARRWLREHEHLLS